MYDRHPAVLALEVWHAEIIGDAVWEGVGHQSLSTG